MKKIALYVLVSVCIVTVLATAAVAGHPMKSESGWFDFENCAFCKNLMEDPELLAHTTWENHTIEKVMMNIMTIDPAYAQAMVTAEQKMNELGKRNTEEMAAMMGGAEHPHGEHPKSEHPKGEHSH